MLLMGECLLAVTKYSNIGIALVTCYGILYHAMLCLGV